MVFIKVLEEVFVDINGYEGEYQVSNYGKVRSLERVLVDSWGRERTIKEKILANRLDGKGYCEVIFKGKPIKVHRLVGLMFIPILENKPQINHIDGDKTNNYVGNLEWCDNSENQLHAYRIGLNKPSPHAGRKNRPVAQIDLKTKEIINTFSSLAEAGRQLKLNQYNIRTVCLGNRNHCGGFGWVFVEEELDEKA